MSNPKMESVAACATGSSGEGSHETRRRVRIRSNAGFKLRAGAQSNLLQNTISTAPVMRPPIFPFWNNSQSLSLVLDGRDGRFYTPPLLRPAGNSLERLG